MFRFLSTTALIAALLATIGCGQPSIPLPPSLNLPRPVQNLTAQRDGDTITLRWTMPKETTDRLPIKGPIPAEIWLRTAPISTPNATTPAHRIGSTSADPAAAAEFTYTLPSDSTRTLQYWSIHLLNSNGHSASGPTQDTGSIPPDAVTLGGPPLPPPTAVAAEYTADGVRLHWQPQPALSEPNLPAWTGSILVHRVLITPPPNARPQNPNIKPNSAPAPAGDLYLTVTVGPGQLESGIALDKTALPNAVYSYSLQRVFRVPIGDAIEVETRSAPTPPISLATKDIFPPAAPTGLAAVIANTNTVDLSWSPNTEPDLAGYLVYRSTNNASRASITPTPVTTPAYRDTPATPSTTYTYCITAIDTSNNASPCSTPETITVP